MGNNKCPKCGADVKYEYDDEVIWECGSTYEYREGYNVYFDESKQCRLNQLKKEKK